MKRVQVRSIFKNTKEYLGKEITVAGWIRQLRDSKKMAFIELNDGSFFKPVQIIAEDEKINNFAEIAGLIESNLWLFISLKKFSSFSGISFFSLSFQRKKATYSYVVGIICN